MDIDLTKHMEAGRTWSSLSELPIPVPDFWIQSCEAPEPTPIFKSRSQSRFEIPADGNDPYPVLSPADLREILTNPMSEFNRIIIVDCRFDYEFRGGHITSAVNIHTHDDLRNLFHKYEQEGDEVLLVFHCELSHDRGPRFMRAFRVYDREVNKGNYPDVTFPHVCLLEGGYKRFYNEVPELCIGGYVPMRDRKHVQNGDLKRSQSQYTQFLSRDVRRPHIARSVSSGAPLSLEDVTLTKSASQ